jgi:hypothetical protein
MPEPIQEQSPAPAAQRTRLGSKWLGKTLIFMLVLIGFGFWGLWDATVVYPNRGIEYADNARWQYLKAARGAGMLYSAGVADPAAAYERVSDPETLKANRIAALDSKSPNQPRALMDERLYAWLDGLHTLGRLKPELTAIAKPDEELADLERKWGTRTQPKPLAKWDLPVQWLFTVVGLGGGLALAVLVLRVKSRSFGWDAATQRLTLPDGSTLVPADIAEFDKRKWDKFLIFLKVKPDHPKHGGKELKLDLYRYVPLEEWVLAMERTAFPEHAPAPAEAPPEQAGAEPAPGA